MLDEKPKWEFLTTEKYCELINTIELLESKICDLVEENKGLKKEIEKHERNKI